MAAETPKVESYTSFTELMEDCIPIEAEAPKVSITARDMNTLIVR